MPINKLVLFCSIILIQNLGICQNNTFQKNYTFTIDSLLNEKKYQEEHKQDHNWILTLTKIAEVYKYLKATEKSISYLILAQTKENSDTLLKIKILRLLAENYNAISDFDKATSCYEALQNQFFEKLNKKEQEGLMQELTVLYNISNANYKAISTSNALLNLLKENKDSVGLTRTYNYIGTIYQKLKNYETAKLYFVKALKYFSKKEYSSANETIVLLNLGTACQANGEYGPALEKFSKALQIQKSSKNYDEMARIFMYMASNHLALKDYEETQNCISRALQIALNKQNLSLQAEAFNLQWQCYELQNDLQSALLSYKNYVEVKEQLYAKKEKEQAQLELKTKQIDLLENKINSLINEREMKDLDLEKQALEHKNKSMEIEILRQELELTNTKNRQKNLELLQAKSNILLLNQKFESQIRESRLSEEIEKRRIENRDKQQKIDSLNTQYKLKNLVIKAKELKISYQNLIQWTLIAFIALSLILFYLLFVRYKLKAKNKEQNLQYQKAEIEQRLLRSQMNPHFIFNALNSIQYYITSHDNASAARYLAKFSNLMRNILENTRHQFVSLEEEIKLLQIYLSLEQLRFSNKFVYHIDIQNDIVQDNVGIPPMMVQPYIENAIVHGLAQLESGGKINITYQMTKDMLECIIEDNGIGRIEAEKIRRTRTSNHKSVATTLTNDRLELLKRKFTTKCKIDIQDLYDQNCNPLGTKVVIAMPLIILS